MYALSRPAPARGVNRAIRALLAVSLIAAFAFLQGIQEAQAADGTILRTISAQNYACSVGTGLAFDGRNLLLSCDYDNVIRVISPVDGSFVDSYSIDGMTAIGALAWDRSHNQLWACGGFGADDTIVYKIDVATKASSIAFSGTMGCPDGLAYDGTDDSLYLSGDAAQTVQHYKVDGTLISNTDVSGLLGGCGNSGIAVGGQYVFMANNGCSQIYQAQKNDFASTKLFGTYPARLEDLECDDVTFQSSGKAAIWSKDAYDGTLNAFELNPGTCGFGGQPSARGYVAMGDSYSAGEGTGDYIPGTDYAADRCHRSLHAYGPIVNDQLQSSRFDFVACSGAVTSDFLTDNHSWGSVEPAQISFATSSTGNVTFTIGGNDVGFAEIINSCIKTNRALGIAGKGSWGCSKDRKLSTQITGRLSALSGSGAATTPGGLSIVSVLNLIRGIHRRAPQAEIVVVGYPQLFGSQQNFYYKDNSAPSKWACDVGAGLSQAVVDYNDAQWMNGLQGKLNGVLSSAVSAAKAEGINAAWQDPTAIFGQHNFCGAQANWFYRLRVDGTAPWVGSFHPTLDGQNAYVSLLTGVPQF